MIIVSSNSSMITIITIITIPSVTSISSIITRRCADRRPGARRPLRPRPPEPPRGGIQCSIAQDSMLYTLVIQYSIVCYSIV